MLEERDDISDSPHNLVRLPGNIYWMDRQALSQRGDLKAAFARLLGDLPHRAEVHDPEGPMGAIMGDRRFRHAWETWDDALDDGASQGELLCRASTRTLVHLLGAQEGKDRAVERNIIATELLNRIALISPPDDSDPTIRAWEIRNIVLTSGRRADESHDLIVRSRSLLAERERPWPHRRARRRLLPDRQRSEA